MESTKREKRVGKNFPKVETSRTLGGKSPLRSKPIKNG